MYCQECGNSFAPNSAGLHCAHIYSRRHAVTRWYPLNCIALCVTCHRYLGENPIDFANFVQRKIGRSELKALHDRHLLIQKYSVEERKLMLTHYRHQLRHRVKQGEPLLAFD